MTASRIRDFDDVFDYIGGFGPYQYLWFFVACFVNWIICFAHFGELFMTLTPPHWCDTLQQEEAIRNANSSKFNMTQENLLRLVIPIATDGNSRNSCYFYALNFTEIILDEIFEPNLSWPVEKCSKGWKYNFTKYYPSITSELNLVCDDHWKVQWPQMSFFMGSLFGIPLFSWMADRFGRLPVVVITNVLGGLFGLASAFTPELIYFCILRFFVGLNFDSFYMITYILAMEYVSTPYRTLIGNLPPVIFLTAALCTVPWIAYYLHDWTYFGIAISVPQLLCIFLPFFLHDSVRWLIAHGKVEKSISIVKSIAKINRRELTEDSLRKFEDYAKEQQNEKFRKVSWYHLFKTPELRKRVVVSSFMWLSIMCTYDGLLRTTQKTGGEDFFINFTYLGLVELPADLLVMYLMEKVGRKHSTVWSLVASGLVVMCVVFVESSDKKIILYIQIIGRFIVTMSINVGIQYIVEILPTEGRAQGSGVAHTFGTGMALISPYIVQLSHQGHWIPFVVMGVLCLFSGFLCILLPETMGADIPNTLEEGEQSFRDQPLFYNPFKRTSKYELEGGKDNPAFQMEEKSSA